MKSYLYKIENAQTKEFYLGVRSCECEIEKDPYMGSSSAWNKAYIKANKENLVKTIVSIFDDRKLANKAESGLIEQFILDPLCVNKYIPKYYKDFMRRTASEETKRLQSLNNTKEKNPFWKKEHTPETKEKLKKVRKERVTKESTREKLREVTSGEKNPFYGKHHTKEVKKSLAQQRKENYVGEGNPFYGKSHTEESKKKMSDSMSGINNPRIKAVIVKDLETEKETNYISITEMCRDLNLPSAGVHKALKANRVYRKKYLIKYANY